MSLSIAVALSLNVNKESAFDVEVLLAHVLQVSRAYLMAFPERILTLEQQIKFENFLEQYVKGIPVAYITGHREFWSLDFLVTQATLIPRPETELLVELALRELSGDKKIIADLGTGSGAIALAIASEKPSWEVHATDKSADALQVAKCNAERFNLTNVIFHQGSWCKALPDQFFDLIVSNPPYIAKDDEHLRQGDLRYEPLSALMAGENGLQDLRQIICEAKNYLRKGAYLMLEHGFQQAEQVREICGMEGYSKIITVRDLAGLERVTIAVN